MKYPVPALGPERRSARPRGVVYLVPVGYLLKLAKFAQEKCGDDNMSSSQVQHFPSIWEKRKEDCLEHTAPSFLALGRERKRLRWLKNRFFEKSRD